MTKRIYNIASVAISFALVAFIVCCIREYFVCGIITPLFYACMSGVSIVAVLANLVHGGVAK